MRGNTYAVNKRKRFGKSTSTWRYFRAIHVAFSRNDVYGRHRCRIVPLGAQSIWRHVDARPLPPVFRHAVVRCRRNAGNTERRVDVARLCHRVCRANALRSFQEFAKTKRRLSVSLSSHRQISWTRDTSLRKSNEVPDTWPYHH